MKNYYNYFNTTKEVIGNTGGLMMIRKNVFENMGFFNENFYIIMNTFQNHIIVLPDEKTKKMNSVPEIIS